LFGSKSSPALSLRKVVGARTNGGGDAANGTPVSWLSALQSRGGRTVSQDGRRDASRPVAPVNYAAVAKEDVPRRRRHTAQVNLYYELALGALKKVQHPCIYKLSTKEHETTMRGFLSDRFMPEQFSCAHGPLIY